MKTFLFALMVFVLLAPTASCKAEEQEAVPKAEATAPDVETEVLIIETQDGSARHEFNVEVANTPKKLMRGLMFRSSMPEDHGMLFLFGQARERNFWMRNTYIPLDIIYIQEDNTIGHIYKNAEPQSDTPLPSKVLALSVLELNGGMTEKLGIKSGDKVYMAGKAKTVAP